MKNLLLAACWFIAACVHAEKLPDLQYSVERKLALDLYLPDGWKPTDSRPTAILIHGGGWSTGSRAEPVLLAQWLAAQGLVAASVDYRLAPTYKWPAQEVDVVQAVWWLRNNAARYGINPKKIVAIGGSAGGQLAAMLGQVNFSDPKTGVPSKVQAVVSLWGPWNLTKPRTADQKGMLKNLLVSPADARGASPIFLISKASAPALLFHGTQDAVVPRQQSVDACNAYASVKALYCNVVSLDGQGHSFPSDVSLVVNPLEKFLGMWVNYPQ